MSWRRADVAAALVNVLTPALTCSVFASWPSTMNPPAVVVGFPANVDYRAPVAFGVDLAELPITCTAGVSEPDPLDALVADVRAALDVDGLADPTLGGVVRSLKVRAHNAWRIVNTAGADVLAADVVLEIQA
jgi:hypothetical protein